MQQSHFIESIKNPALLVGKVDELLLVTKEFPYCQTTYLMMALLLKNNNDIQFDEYLKKAAVYCTDRYQLFTQLHQPSAAPTEIVSTPNLTQEEKKIENLLPITEAVVDEIPIEAVNKNNPIAEFEHEYIAQAINSSILIETTNQAVDEKEVSELTEELTEIEKNAFNLETAHTFTDWISFFNQGNVEKLPPKNEEKTLEKTNKFDLIDKFIQEDPKIQPKKTEFYSPMNMARLSVVDNLDVVSETLALVHVDQGNYQKAILMYEKLSLKFPKKRSYFATQIKNLKQKLK
ncbi:MAG: hypothetical protein CVT95_12720 [Bacteroidetes bacterium HGW-Bacteroidetes-12]|nr:MAG: hypothetical protein CVT95_12720 [Bacteroidetes bacterium HGW-Bacteroidetes-12]